MPCKIIYFENIGHVKLNRNSKSKGIKISVKPDCSVLVSYPLYIKVSKVLLFVEKNKLWILEQKRKINSKKKVLKEGSEIKTKLYVVELCKGEKINIKKSEGKIKLFLNEFNSANSLSALEDLLEKIYRAEAKNILPCRLMKLAADNGFIYNKVTIRNNKWNWGSCSSQNNISLNLQMMKMPDELIDYILLHELVHTKIKNHSKLFWNELNRLTNNRAVELAERVKNYSTYTL